MDSNENKFSIFKDNEEVSLEYYNQCESASWIKKFFQDPVDTSKMSKDIFGLYSFSQKILDLMDKFIKDILSIGDLQNILMEGSNYFSIIDPSDCTTLSEKYQFLNLELPKYQKLYIRSQEKKDYLYLLDGVLRTLDSFVRPSLTILERNITKLLFKVRRIKNKKLKIENKKVKTAGNKINGVIVEYLNQLHQTLNEFEIKDVPEKINKRKKRIEKKIEKTINNKINAMEISLINEATNSVPSVKESYNLDQYIDSNEIKDGNYEVSDTESQAEMIHDQGNPFSHTTENYGQYVFLNNNRESFNDDKLDYITSDHNNVSQFSLSLFLIISVSSCVIIGLLSFLIVFGYIKYKKSKRTDRTEKTYICYKDDSYDTFKEDFIAD